MLPGGPFHGAPATVATTVSIHAGDAEGPRRVTKVMGYGQGGFALIAPYHRARSGVLVRTLFDYSSSISVGDEPESFAASDRVKLSYHPDGFVQFSGERPGRIVSGRDQLTGEPKGLGLLANPMDAPVMTGPAIGITLWGLQEFDEQKGKPRGDHLVFGPNDFIYDHCDESDWGSYGIEFFIFGVYFQPYVRKLGGTRFEMPLWHNQYHGGGRHFNFKVIRLGQQPYFLGAVCFRRPAVEFEASSGWSMGTPGALTKGPVKPILHAFYPEDGWPEPSQTLDYVPPLQPETEGAGAVPHYARDYGAMLAMAEARLFPTAETEVPAVAVLREGAGVVAELLDGVSLTAAHLESAGGARMLAATSIGFNGLRAARGCALLVGAGYVLEASSVLERLKSAARLSRVLSSDSGDVLARRFVGGDDLRELEIEDLLLESDSVAVLFDHLPPVSLVHADGGEARAGLGFVGRDNAEGQRLALRAALLLSMVVDFVRGVFEAQAQSVTVTAASARFASGLKEQMAAWRESHPSMESPATGPTITE